MTGREVRNLPSFEIETWVEVEGRGEMMVLRNYPLRRLELIAEISGDGIRHIDVSYDQIEPTPEGLLVLNRADVRTYFRENEWIYKLLKSKLEANQNGRRK